MTDWIDHLADGFFHFGSWLCEGRNIKQVCGIVSVLLALFVLVGAIIASNLDVPLNPMGWYFIIPLEVVLAGAAAYCFLTSEAEQ